jgi:hypothetical protein
MARHAVLAVWLAVLGLSSPAFGRIWTDSTGKYTVEAELIRFDDSTVVLKRNDHQLVAVPIDQLSEEDRAFLKSQGPLAQGSRSAGAMQTWTMTSGLKVVGRVVDYTRRDITLQQRRGRTYVNDRPLANLPEVYQRMLPRIVSHFEGIVIEDQRGLDAWLLKLRGQPRTFTCEGVILELENGDEYGVPFFLFSNDDRKVLEPGWQRWLSQEKDRNKQQHESFLLQAQTEAYQQDRRVNQQLAVLQLQMQAYQAGLFDLWEVRLFPGPGVASPPLLVVVPARDSRSAAVEAVRRNPGFAPGAVSRVRRAY